MVVELMAGEAPMKTATKRRKKAVAASVPSPAAS